MCGSGTVFVQIDAAACTEGARILSRGLRGEHIIATEL